MSDTLMAIIVVGVMGLVGSIFNKMSDGQGISFTSLIGMFTLTLGAGWLTAVLLIRIFG